MDDILAADDWIERALAGELGEVGRVLIECLVLSLCPLVGDPLTASNLLQRLVDPLLRDVRLCEDTRRVARRLGRGRQEQMLGGYVLVV